MTDPSARPADWNFDGWTLRPAQRLLLVGGAPVPLGGRAFDLLVALAERHGELLHKSELLEAAWPGLVVEENNISVQIATLRKLLGAQAITTVAGHGYRLSAIPVEPDVPPAQPSAAPVPAMLRPPAPAAGVFGRQADVAEVLERLKAAPLVTITGTGGVGKTTLAQAVLASAVPLPGPQQIHWMDLAPLQDGTQLLNLLAQALGVQSSQGGALDDLLVALAHLQGLVALDNCEHLLAEVAQVVGPALQRAPGVRWLATSQEPLHLDGELVYRLRPLDLPATNASLHDAAGTAALALLCHRASAAGAGFALTESNLATAIDLCQQLDGLPLAIEMAACQVASLGLDSVHQQLAQRLHLRSGRRLGPARHHTLRSMFDWSYRLLSPDERRLFRCLEPFRGGVHTGMVLQMLGGMGANMPQWQVMQALAALVDKSLVHRAGDAGSRCFLSESARHYARAMQGEEGDAAAIRQRHAEVVADAFAQARPDHDRLRDADWAARYGVERHNVRAALDWACEAGPPDLLARLVAALAQIDTFARNPAEMVHLQIPLDRLDQASPALRAAARVELSWAHFLDGSRTLGTTLASSALADFQAIGDSVGAYQALAQLVRLYEARPGQIDNARQALAMLREIDDRQVPLKLRLFCAIGAGLQYEGGRDLVRMQAWHDTALRAGFDMLAAVCRAHITDELLIQGRFQEVVDRADEYVAAGEPCPRVNAIILVNQILARVQLGQTGQAFLQARTVLRAMPSVAYLVVAAFALAAAREGRHADAALMTGYCARVRQERDQRADPAEAAATAETARLLAGALAADALHELLQMGAALSLDDAWAMLRPA